VIARLGQARDALAGEAPAVASVRALTGLDEAGARTALAAFGLGAERAQRPAETLSPGERTRAELAVLAHRRASCLLLDEPTNHLDVASLEVLEAALDGWPGGLVVATHDARLRDALAVTEVIDL
jgi:ATPase subunit of ABC transporter with duplicated ATPase domains